MDSGTDLLDQRAGLQRDDRAERDRDERGRQDRDAGDEPSLLDELTETGALDWRDIDE